MRQHAGVFAANFSSNLLWQNCFAPKKSAFCAEPRRAAAGILDVCQGGATTGLRETRLLRRMFSYVRWPKGFLFCWRDRLPRRRERWLAMAGAERCGHRPYEIARDSRIRGADRVVRPYDVRQGAVRNGTAGASYPKGICSAALHGRTPSPANKRTAPRRGAVLVYEGVTTLGSFPSPC